MKQSDDMARAQATVELADVLAQFIGRLFRKRPVPPPEGWQISFTFTTLGGIDVYTQNGMPIETRQLFLTLVRVLAWLCPGPRESAALRLLVEWQNMARDNGCQSTPEHVAHALRGLRESNTAAYARIDQLEEEKSRWQP